MNFIQIARKQMGSCIWDAYIQCVTDGVLPEGAPQVQIQAPKAAAHGDISTSFALTASKALKKPPLEIAGLILPRIKTDGTFLSGFETASPGFINARYDSSWYGAVLDSVLTEEDYGRASEKKNKRIMVEFVSANPTGPMTIGNARGGVLGDTLAAVLDASGVDVWREFYLNDAGNQVENFGKSLYARLHQISGEDVPVPEDGYFGEYITEFAQNYLDENGNSILKLPEEEQQRLLVEYALPKNIEAMKNDLERYRISFDRWFAESELHKSGYVDETIGLLTQRGHTYEKDGALWFRATEFGCEKDDVLRKSNGFYTYYAVDIAYHRDKLERRGFDTAIDVLGADHHGHTVRFRAGMQALGIDPGRLEFVLMQMVRLTRAGEVVRMSKRTGKAITLSDLLDEIPVDAARYFFNSRQPDNHLEFDMGLAVEKTSENPVYYVQYAHARICSLLDNVDASVEGYDYSLLAESAELELLRCLADFPEEIEIAARDYEPGRINRYLVECASYFHRFYNSCRIKEAPPELLKARLSLALAARRVLRNGLDLLGIDAPESM